MAVLTTEPMIILLVVPTQILPLDDAHTPHAAEVILGCEPTERYQLPLICYGSCCATEKLQCFALLLLRAAL